MNRWILFAAVFAVQPGWAAEFPRGKADRGGLPKILGEASRPAGRPGTSGSKRQTSKYAPPPFTVKLPSGTELTQTLMELPKNWMENLFPKDAPVYVEKSPSDKVRGVYTFTQGKLNGPAAVVYEDGGLSMLASYVMSDRDGMLRRWEENKHRLLYADYKRGKKHGLVCLFREDLPWFIQEYDAADVATEYLVKWKEGTAEALSRNRLQADDLRELISARTKLTEMENQLEKSESDVRKSLREWFIEKEKEARKKRVAKQSAARRDEQRNREDAAQRNMQTLLRSTLRATGF